MKPKTDRPRFRVEFSFTDRMFLVKWKDSRGKQCRMSFGTEAAAREWAAQEEARDEQPSVKEQE